MAISIVYLYLPQQRFVPRLHGPGNKIMIGFVPPLYLRGLKRLHVFPSLEGSNVL